MDIKGEYVPIKRDIKLVDDDTLKFIDSKILRQFGVPLPILTGDYTKDQYEAFYQKTLEPLIISISQAFTKSLFGNQKNYGNKIAFYSKELMFMSVSQKLEMVRVLGDSGSLYENEKRVAFGLRPLPELAGVRKQSLNYVDVEIANQYQLQNQKQKKMKELETRKYNFEVRAEQDEKHGNIITGVPIVYEKETVIAGCFREIIHKGALDKADLTDVRFLVNHKLDGIPLARSRKNTENSTMKLTVGNNGLNIRVDLDTENNLESRSLYSAVQRGDITGMSFLFGVNEERWEDLDKDLPLRHIYKISTVVEVSAVTMPAYIDTEINARGKSAVETARQLVETERQKRGKSVDTDLLALAKEKIKNVSICMEV